MRCEEYLLLVEDYFDGELDARTTELAGQHLSACASCAARYQKLEREHEFYLSNECDARPAPDFWDNVMAKAAQERSARPADFLSGLRQWLNQALHRFAVPRFSPSLTALIVLVAIGITAGLMRYLNSREQKVDTLAISQNTGAQAVTPPARLDEIGPTVNQPASGMVGKGSQTGISDQPRPKNAGGRGNMVLAVNRVGADRSNRKTAKSDSALTPDELIHQAEQKYVAAITILSRDVRNRRSQLDAESAERFERTLAAIDRTIADTRRAAREHPGDPVAAQYMLTAYAKKVDVLREMIGY